MCRSCSKDLAHPRGQHNYVPDDDTITVIEAAYRSSLIALAWDPRLLDNATNLAFRRFIEDMLELLIVVLSFPAERSDRFVLLSLSRQTLLSIIAGLVQKATLSNDPTCRNVRYRRSLLLWSSLFQILSERQGKDLECCSRYSPICLRRRFTTALEHLCRQRWPYNPYPAQMFSLRFK